VSNSPAHGADGGDLAPVVEITARHAAPRRRQGALVATSAENPSEGLPEDDDAFLAALSSALPSPTKALRALIVTLALAQLVLVLPWLVDRDPFGLLETSSPAHLARDGALGLVVAVAALLAAWRPRWAIPCFAIGSVTLVAQTLAGLIDNDPGGSTGRELVHVPSIALTFLVALSAIRLTALGPRR
jgi:hypothetical protein